MTYREYSTDYVVSVVAPTMTAAMEKMPGILKRAHRTYGKVIKCVRGEEVCL